MYAQHGEDEFLADYLVSNEIYVAPVFVDIGGGDFMTGSNSRLFAERYGYSVLVVDANQEILDKIEHPDDWKIHIECAMIANKAFPGKLIENIEGDWQTMTVKRMKKASKNTIQTTRLSKLLIGLEEEIGILSIDIEDRSTEALVELFENSEIRPHVIIAEANDLSGATKQMETLEAEYELIATYKVNRIFIRKDLHK